MSRSAVIRLLVVDDDARVLRALQELIEVTDGVEVIATAKDVRGALDADQRLAPTAALVDVLLPDRADGLEVVSSLSRRGRRVVATSVSAAVRADALAAGAACFIEKAPDPGRLLAALRHSAD